MSNKAALSSKLARAHLNAIKLKIENDHLIGGRSHELTSILQDTAEGQNLLTHIRIKYSLDQFVFSLIRSSSKKMSQIEDLRVDSLRGGISILTITGRKIRKTIKNMSHIAKSVISIASDEDDQALIQAILWADHFEEIAIAVCFDDLDED